MTTPSPTTDTTDTTDTTVRPSPASRPPLRSLAIWAATIPVLVTGGFAMVAIVPVSVVVVRTLRRVRLRALRAGAVALGVAYALPLVLWAIGPERERSLSRDMHPSTAVLIVAVALAFLAATLVHARRAGRREEPPAQDATAA